MTEAEQAQERTQRRRRADLLEQSCQPAVTQQVHVGDRVRADTIPATSARTFAVAFAPPVAAIRSRSVSNVANPHRVASANTAASPAHDRHDAVVSAQNPRAEPVQPRTQVVRVRFTAVGRSARGGGRDLRRARLEWFVLGHVTTQPGELEPSQTTKPHLRETDRSGSRTHFALRDERISGGACAVPKLAMCGDLVFR